MSSKKRGGGKRTAGNDRTRSTHQDHKVKLRGGQVAAGHPLKDLIMSFIIIGSSQADEVQQNRAAAERFSKLTVRVIGLLLLCLCKSPMKRPDQEDKFSLRAVSIM